MGLGTIYVLTPAVGWAFPLVWPIIMALAGAKGYTLLTSTQDDAPLRGQLNRQLNTMNTVAIPLEQVIKDMVADEVGREQVLRFVKDDIILVFKRDARGKFSVEVSGPESMPRVQLEVLGMQFANELVQQFAYNKTVAEMERKGAYVVGEEVNENGDIVLKMRRWE